MAKLWKGRFKATTNKLLEKYTESISFDKELAMQDIKGSIAHAKMLEKVGLIQKKEYEDIKNGLKKIEDEIKQNKFVFNTEDEDIHMAIEAELTRKIGVAAKKLHTARSRNDQVATDLRLWTREKIDDIKKLIVELQKSLLDVAKKEKNLVIPGYTHLQRAQPILLAQHLLAYMEMLQRDYDRLDDAKKRVNILPLGACALAGTTLPIDRKMVAEELNFEKIAANSMDAVADRDFVIETLAALAVIAIHLSRLSEDIINWTSSEWGLAKLADNWSTGSSIMPQKRNPDLLELTRGKSARVIADLVNILVLLKGLPMTYNRDLQEDKEPLFDAVKTIDLAIRCMTEFLPTLEFIEKKAEKMLEDGFLEATALAEYLVIKGMPFREAHEVTGSLVRMAEESNRKLDQLTLKEMSEMSELFQKDVRDVLVAKEIPNKYVSEGSAGKNEVEKEIKKWTEKLYKN